MLAMAEKRRRPHILGEAQSYDELAAILAARRQALGLTQMDLGYIAGLQDGYVGKLELGHKPRKDGQPTTKAIQSPGRTAGPKTLYEWLRTLGVKLVVVEDKPKDNTDEQTDETARRRSG